MAMQRFFRVEQVGLRRLCAVTYLTCAGVLEMSTNLSATSSSQAAPGEHLFGDSSIMPSAATVGGLVSVSATKLSLAKKVQKKRRRRDIGQPLPADMIRGGRLTPDQEVLLWIQEQRLQQQQQQQEALMLQQQQQEMEQLFQQQQIQRRNVEWTLFRAMLVQFDISKSFRLQLAEAFNPLFIRVQQDWAKNQAELVRLHEKLRDAQQVNVLDAQQDHSKLLPARVFNRLITLAEQKASILKQLMEQYSWVLTAKYPTRNHRDDFWATFPTEGDHVFHDPKRYLRTRHKLFAGLALSKQLAGHGVNGQTMITAAGITTIGNHQNHLLQHGVEARAHNIPEWIVEKAVSNFDSWKKKIEQLSYEDLMRVEFLKYELAKTLKKLGALQGRDSSTVGQHDKLVTRLQTLLRFDIPGTTGGPTQEVQMTTAARGSATSLVGDENERDLVDAAPRNGASGSTATSSHFHMDAATEVEEQQENTHHNAAASSTPKAAPRRRSRSSPTSHSLSPKSRAIRRAQQMRKEFYAFREAQVVDYNFIALPANAVGEELALRHFLFSKNGLDNVEFE
ncbi:unnamed protein product [Amoebophrya sp. A120]|nr:unnamed protein product [Amoebophrya sp. A120]|eukprot:GSA120T00022366001.1